MGPPHHQVGEGRDPGDGAQEGDGEELLGRLAKGRETSTKMSSEEYSRAIADEKGARLPVS